MRIVFLSTLVALILSAPGCIPNNTETADANTNPASTATGGISDSEREYLQNMIIDTMNRIPNAWN